jgi:hypothetical protein
MPIYFSFYNGSLHCNISIMTFGSFGEIDKWCLLLVFTPPNSHQGGAGSMNAKSRMMDSSVVELTQEMNEPKAGGKSVSGQMKQQGWANTEAWWGWCIAASPTSNEELVECPGIDITSPEQSEMEMMRWSSGKRRWVIPLIIYHKVLRNEEYPRQINLLLLWWPRWRGRAHCLSKSRRYKSALKARDSHCLDSKCNDQHVPRSTCTSRLWGIRGQRCQSLEWWLVARQYQHQLFSQWAI